MKILSKIIALFLTAFLLHSCAIKSVDQETSFVFPNDSIVQLVGNIKQGTAFSELPDEFKQNYIISADSESESFVLDYRLSNNNVLKLQIDNIPEISFIDYRDFSSYHVKSISICGIELAKNDEGYFTLPKNTSFKRYETKWVSECISDDVSKINSGMTESEVFDILGKNYDTLKRRGLIVESLKYVLSDGSVVEISFEESVESKDGTVQISCVVKENGVKVTQ